MKELDDLRRKDASAYANQKISLETELQTLEKYLEDMKAVYQLNEEKLEFNDKVLSERENVNQNTKKTLTKKERRLKDNKSTVRAQYFNQDRRFKKENYTTTEDYKRITRQFKELQKKFRHFEKSDKKRFDEIWEMNDAEVKAMIDKIIKADKVVHVQQLGIPWVPPSDPIFGFSDASSIMQHSVSASNLLITI
jgi:dynein regulatry complex protein 1